MNNKIPFDSPCPCGSAKTYINCCWLQQLLRAEDKYKRLMNERLRQAMRGKVFMDAEIARAYADDFFDTVNQEPQPVFLGLSAEQVRAFLDEEYESSENIVKFNSLIEPAEFQAIPIVRDASLFLTNLAAVEPLKATAKGNLPLKFAEPLFQAIDDSRMKPYIKFRSEEDSLKLQVLRHLLTLGGWIRKTKQKFYLTKRGQTVVRSGFTAEHFLRLFNVYTRKFRWGYLDYFEEFWIIQGAWLFSLYVLQKKASDFIKDSILFSDFITAFPSMMLELDPSDPIGPFDAMAHCYSWRTYEFFFHWFGFIDIRTEETGKSLWGKNFIKKTEFFKKFFLWET